MIRIFQTKFGHEDGNCMAACIASLTGIKIDELPVADNKFWINDFNRVLNKYHLSLIMVDARNIAEPILVTSFDGLFILQGPAYGARNDKDHHAIIGRLSDDGMFELVHDPCPKSSGIKNVEYVGFIVNLYRE